MGSETIWVGKGLHDFSQGFNSSITWLLKNTADSITERRVYRVNGKWTQFQRQKNMYLSLENKKKVQATALSEKEMGFLQGKQIKW